MNKNEVKKFLYKNKELMAKFSHYISGNLYYTVALEDGIYQFPISTVDTIFGSSDYALSADLGTTSFDSEIKASFLNRWIDKAIGAEVFIKI